MFTVQETAPAWLEDETGHRHPIRGTSSLGRSASNQIPLPDDKVSRRHAVIQAQQGEEFWLVDFGSRNGTFLNDKRIAQPTRLQHGDRLRIGSARFVFHHSTSVTVGLATTLHTDRTVVDIKLENCWLLVADIIDSSKLVNELPPDELPLVTGQWVGECKHTIESLGGRINQFMGDGFFAFWRDHEQVVPRIHQALEALKRMQEQSRPAFRLVVHFGKVTIGGVSVGEEERISGSEVHFIFRQEKVCGKLGEARLLSEAARQRLAGLIETREAGRHPLSGFEGEFPFYAF